MGLHQKHAHKRGIDGDEAAEHLAIEKRDSHRASPMMNIPDEFQEKVAANQLAAKKLHEQQKEKAASTLYSIVYVTASPTFSGPTAGYITVGASGTSAANSAAGTPLQNSRTTVEISTETASPIPSSSSSSTWTFGGSIGSTLATSSAVATGTSLGATQAAGVVVGTPLSATRSATPDNSTPSGMSSGAKAGLAIGILLAIAAAAGLVLFCIRRRKNQNAGREEIIDEKRASIYGGNNNANTNRFSTSSDRVAPSVRTNRTASTAPRLSLRPVTQFMGFGLNQADNATGEMSEKPSVWERRPANAAEDPFRDGAAMTEKPTNPFAEPEAVAPTPFSVKSGNANHAAKSSYDEPLTPTSAQFGTAAAVPVTAASRGPNNVHRVQLDFKPSMDDELELRSGQLVRMLHEYDDGWALCIRMDRSQQGVTPRTCLSKLPVKPRPQGPPQGTANNRPGARTSSSSAISNMSSMAPRPLTPSGRPSTPDGRQRSQTIEQSQSGPTSAEERGLKRSFSLNQARVPARKPVPGQAI